MKINKLDIKIYEQLSLFESTSISRQYNEYDLYDALYNYIITTKSIKDIDIEIPSMDIECSRLDFTNIGKIYKKKGGIYFLFGEKGELLNIGNTSDLYDRICKKLTGKNGGSVADFLFFHYYASVSLFCESDEMKRKLYEPYLINKLRPPLNKEFNYYDTNMYYVTLQKEKAARNSFNSTYKNYH